MKKAEGGGLDQFLADFSLHTPEPVPWGGPCYTPRREACETVTWDYPPSIAFVFWEKGIEESFPFGSTRMLPHSLSCAVPSES